MNGDCNRGRFLLVVPQCYSGDNHAIRNTTLGQIRDETEKRTWLSSAFSEMRSIIRPTVFLSSGWLVHQVLSLLFTLLLANHRWTAKESYPAAVPKKNRLNSWYQAGKFLVSAPHWTPRAVKCRKATAKLRFEVQAGMCSNFRAMAGGALIGQNHRNRHMACGNTGLKALICTASKTFRWFFVLALVSTEKSPTS